jgi:hypothetical protein
LDFFLLVLLVDFFAAFLRAPFLALDLWGAFLAFLLLPALEVGADFLAFFAAFAMAFTGRVFAAAFLTRLTTAWAASKWESSIRSDLPCHAYKAATC